MNLAILTPEQEYFSGEVNSVIVPGITGNFEILNNHAPLVSALKSGAVRITKVGGEVMSFDILKGFLEVSNNEVSLLVQGLAEK
ncbi:UNVERIFIED_CONTAM: hypothetical protein GTU68_066745 [Idotea baltica]|nr:hypothetical protein [Idotea baltica]